MSEHILQTGAALPAFTTGSLIKASDALNLAESERILEVAKKIEADSREASLREAEEQRKAGYAQGLREGLLEARVHNLQTLADTSRMLEGVHSRICSTVVACLRTILKEMPPAERIAQSAAVAMETVNLQQTIVLCVNPAEVQTAAPIATKLSQLMSSGARVECRGREDVQSGDCVLETPMGIIRCSLEDQLAAVEKALRASEA
jgi:type III secretion protein L